jgi:isochorismate pyruvate lyase
MFLKMKKPEECLDMQEIRNEIDQIDKNIIDQLGLRINYVKAAAKFKKNELAVKAPERFVAMLSQRRIWAEQNNLSADVIEKMYRDLVNYFIGEELRHFGEK